MFSRAAQVFTPNGVQARNMSTLKAISMRLKSVKNIQKITQSMKMVSAAKFSRSERELKQARPYGHGALAFYESAEVQQDETKPNHLIIAVTSDRGLCGAVHSNIVRNIRAKMAAYSGDMNVKLVLIGDKARSMLARVWGNNIMMHVSNIGKKPPTFNDASAITQAILATGYEYDYGEMIYNRFKTVVSYETKANPLYSIDNVNNAEKLAAYDSLDEEVMRSYYEFSLASQVFFSLKESACSEQSSRMTAMDAASKNAGEMINKLELTYNRTRQAVITKELIEIISGAAAV